MRTHRQTLAACLLVMLALAGCSQTGGGNQQASNSASNTSSAQQGGDQIATSTKAPPADVVKVSIDNVDVKAGGSAEAGVKLTIANGYHINANPPSFSYLKATELQVAAGEGLTVGKPVYPQSVMRKFSFSNGEALAVYEGDSVIKLPLQATAGAKKGAQKLKGQVRIQACDDEACYPPRTIETSIPVTVK